MRFNPSMPAIVCGLLLAASASAQTPVTQPATVAETPMAFMLAYDSLAGQGPAVYLALYDFDPTDDDSNRLAHVQSKFDAEAGMLQKMVQQQWGSDAVNDVLHALGLKSAADIKTATVKEFGERATVLFSDGTPGPDLIKTAAGWKLNITAFKKSLGIPVDDYLKQIRQLSKVLPDVADEIASGKLNNSASAVSEIIKRINATAP